MGRPPAPYKTRACFTARASPGPPRPLFTVPLPPLLPPLRVFFPPFLFVPARPFVLLARRWHAVAAHIGGVVRRKIRAAGPTEFGGIDVRGAARGAVHSGVGEGGENLRVAASRVNRLARCDLKALRSRDDAGARRDGETQEIMPARRVA